jgi:hypothetical protein
MSVNEVIIAYSTVTMFQVFEKYPISSNQERNSHRDMVTFLQFALP